MVREAGRAKMIWLTEKRGEATGRIDLMGKIAAEDRGRGGGRGLFLATELQAARSDGGYRVGMVGQNMVGARIEGGDFLFVEADETPPEGVVSSPYSGAGQR